MCNIASYSRTMNELEEVLLTNITIIVNLINNTTTTDLTSYYQYVCFGSAAVLANLFVIIVFCQNKLLFKRSAFILGLAFGDVLNGVALCVSGIVRILYICQGKSKLMVHPFTCIKSFTQLFLSGNQITALMFVAIGAERFLAIKYFEWYHNKWSHSKAWSCTAVVYGYCTISLAAAWFMVYWQPSISLVSITCGTPTVVGKAYSIYNYSLAIIGGTLASVLTIAATVTFSMRKKHLLEQNSNNGHGFVHRQWRLTKVMTCVAVMDFCLVAVPNILLLLTGGFKIQLGGNVGGWSLQVICFRSVVNLFIYLCSSGDFRRAVRVRFHLKSMSTHPLANSNNNHQT